MHQELRDLSKLILLFFNFHQIFYHLFEHNIKIATKGALK